MKRAFFAVFVWLLAFTVLTLGISAASDEYGAVEIPEEEWANFEDSLPDEVKDRLPSGSPSGSGELADTVAEMSGSEYIMTVLLDTLGVQLGGALRLLLVLCALLLVAAVFNTMGEGMGNPSLSAAMRFCSAGAVISVVVYTQYTHFDMLEEFFSKLGTMMSGMIPVVASVWAMGGNVTTAGAGSATFYVMLTVCRELWANTVIPVCCVLTVLGFCDALSEEVKTGKIVSAIKKIYNFLLGIVMTVLLASLAAQTSLAAAADTTAARTARMISGTVIPVVGGSVGETFRTLAGGISYLKNIFGIGGIMMLVILVLPVAVCVLLTRFVFLIAAGLADMLGCQGEARLLENLGEVYGSMLAVVSGVAIMFILALCIFMQTVVAVM